jgi:hypothetical protein
MLTLPDMIITMLIFGSLVLAMVYTHIFVLKQDQLVSSKLGASDNSRVGFDYMVNDIRESKVWWVGSGDASSFSRFMSVTQQGNALQLSFSLFTNKTYVVDTNIYVRYYFQVPGGGTNGLYNLYRLDSNSSTNPTPRVIARNLTNTVYFMAEDFLGNPMHTNDSTYKYLIHVQMNFAQYQYPLTKVGSNCYYDSYRLDFKATPHCPDQQ